MNKIINTILFFLAFCCFYAIGNITLGWFWAIGYAENSQEINTIILNLSYSYIAGIIVYILTVMLPVIWENYRLQPILKEQVKSIGIMLANMLVGFPYEEDYLKIDISDIEKCREILSNADWNNENKLWIYPKGKNKLFQTFKSDFDEIQNEITILIQKAYAFCVAFNLGSRLLKRATSCCMRVLGFIIKSRIRIVELGLSVWRS